jgi:hypothetical protein
MDTQTIGKRGRPPKYTGMSAEERRKIINTKALERYHRMKNDPLANEHRKAVAQSYYAKKKQFVEDLLKQIEELKIRKEEENKIEDNKE